MSQKKNKPSHYVYHVRSKGEKNRSVRIGAAWWHSDGNGLNLRLNYLPLIHEGFVSVRPAQPISPETE